MVYNLGSRNITIPENEISKSMEILGLSREEAVQVWLEDNEYLENEEQNELDEKASKVKTSKGIGKKHEKKSEPKEPKEDPVKTEVIKVLAEMLKSYGTNVTITNPTKIVEFEKDGDRFKLDLIRRRK